MLGRNGVFCLGVIHAWAVPTVLSSQPVLEPQDAPCWVRMAPLPLTMLREADIGWERRVWRAVDVKDRSSLPILSAKRGDERCPDLFAVLRHGLMTEGGITAYLPGSAWSDDTFASPMDRASVERMFAAFDSTRGELTRILLKEDWIFDLRRSEMEVRIIGLALQVADTGEDGEFRGHRTLCWFHYPECRLWISHWSCASDPDGAPITFNDLFERRMFRSAVLKVSNTRNTAIGSHGQGSDALFQSDAVRDQLFRMGFDLWHY